MYTTASITSPRLCGGMFVAIPTAMPLEPFTSRFGNRLGSTAGCVVRDPYYTDLYRRLTAK